jgi:hypothetical protein
MNICSIILYIISDPGPSRKALKLKYYMCVSERERERNTLGKMHKMIHKIKDMALSHFHSYMYKLQKITHNYYARQNYVYYYYPQCVQWRISLQSPLP